MYFHSVFKMGKKYFLIMDNLVELDNQNTGLNCSYEICFSSDIAESYYSKLNDTILFDPPELSAISIRGKKFPIPRQQVIK